MADPVDHDDRREHQRAPLRLLVQFRFHSFEDFLEEYSGNISAGGVFIETEEPYEEGAVIFLQFKLEDGETLIEGMGRVVRVLEPEGENAKSGMGVEFLSFDDQTRALIDDICANRLAASR